jgi:hypothetical protein
MLLTYMTLNTNVRKAIRNHLMEVDALPPTMALSELASELTELVFAEMSGAGLTKEAIESFDRLSSTDQKTTRKRGLNRIPVGIGS